MKIVDRIILLKNKIIIKYKKFLKRFKGYVYIFNYKYIRDKNNRRKLLMGINSLIILVFIMNIYSSYGYYYDKKSLSLIKSVVGNKNTKDADYALLVYIEEGINTNKYILTSKIPLIGYAYKNYNCKNGTELIYDDVNKTATANFSKKEECSIYFNKVIESDINVHIMLEDKLQKDKYIEALSVPEYGYIYNGFKCDNDSNITYDYNNNKILLEASKKDNCNVYFKSLSADIIINLYLVNQNNKIEIINTIPTDKTYIIDEEKTQCKNSLNETINNSISIDNGYIDISTNERSYCEIFIK